MDALDPIPPIIPGIPAGDAAGGLIIPPYPVIPPATGARLAGADSVVGRTCAAATSSPRDSPPASAWAGPVADLESGAARSAQPQRPAARVEIPTNVHARDAVFNTRMRRLLGKARWLGPHLG